MNESLFDILMNLHLPNLIGVVIAFYLMTRGMRADISTQSKRSDDIYKMVLEENTKRDELLQSMNARVSRMEGFMWADMDQKMKTIKGE